MTDRRIVERASNGHSVTIVLPVKRGHALPATWHGIDVVDGDETDERFLDAPGVIVALRAKGDAKHDVSGFVRKLTATA